MKSQNEEILAWLQKGRSISPSEALERFGCFRLGGRIFDLKQQGHPIKTEMVEKNGKRFAQYSLENEQPEPNSQYVSCEPEPIFLIEVLSRVR